MLPTEEALSANEAATVTGVPLKQVHRIVDAGVLDGAVENRGGRRVIHGRGLIGLKLAHSTAHLLTTEGRRRLVRRVLDRPNEEIVREDAVTVDLRPIESEVRRGLSALEKARNMVAVDESIMGGTPCFRGTRIPVHAIAEMIANGDEKPAILEAYPRLSAEQIDLAVLYAQAYPPRGRPRRSPSWRSNRPISSKEISIR